jgi:hypothetical protein
MEATPSKLVEVCRRFGRKYCLSLRVRTVSQASRKQSTACCFLSLFSGSKMETVRSSETSVNFYKSTRRHTAEDCILYSHLHENLKSNEISLVLRRYYISSRLTRHPWYWFLWKFTFWLHTGSCTKRWLSRGRILMRELREFIVTKWLRFT